MILNLVYQVGRMFQSHPHGQSFAFDVQMPCVQAAVHIAGRVTRGQDDRLAPQFLLLTAYGIHGKQSLHLSVPHEQVGHACLEVHLAAASQDGQAHVLDDAGQPVGADVRMCVGQNVLLGPMLHEDAQDAVGISALLTACEELAVAVGTRSALAKGVVALGIHALFHTYARHILLPFPHVLASLDDHRVQSQFDEAQRRKESARAGTHHQHAPGLAHVVVFDGGEECLLGLLVKVCTHGQIDIHGALPRVDAPPQHPYGLWFDAPVALQKSDDALLVIGILGQYSQIEFLCHNVEMRCKVISFPPFGQIPVLLCWLQGRFSGAEAGESGASGGLAESGFPRRGAGCAGGFAGLLAARQYFGPDEPVRCVGHRSALRWLLQRAA